MTLGEGKASDQRERNNKTPTQNRSVASRLQHSPAQPVGPLQCARPLRPAGQGTHSYRPLWVTYAPSGGSETKHNPTLLKCRRRLYTTEEFLPENNYLFILRCFLSAEFPVLSISTSLFCVDRVQYRWERYSGCWCPRSPIPVSRIGRISDNRSAG